MDTQMQQMQASLAQGLANTAELTRILGTSVAGDGDIGTTRKGLMKEISPKTLPRFQASGNFTTWSRLMKHFLY